MKLKTTSRRNSFITILLILIFLVIGILDFVSPCYAQDPWTEKASMPTGRWEHATCVVDGKIYAIGGASYYSPKTTVEVYDPAADAWTSKSDMPTARQGLTVSVVNGKIYAIGGGTIEPTFTNGECLSVVEEYDPVTDTWTSKADMITAIGWHTANVLDGKIYILGGVTESVDGPSGGTAIIDVYIYNPVTNSWAQKTNASGDVPERIGAGWSSVVDGMIYVFAGYGGPNKVYEYNPNTNTWTRKKNMLTWRISPSTSVLDGEIYVIGGHPGTAPYPALADVEVYNPSTNTFRMAADMLNARCGVRTSVVNGKIYAIGGYSGNFVNTMCRPVEEYDPSKDLTGIERTESKRPGHFELHQNYPNPFNSSTRISYSIPNSGFVLLKVYDLRGREVQTLVSNYQNANTHSVRFNADKISSGYYLYKLQTDDGYSEMKKMIIIK
jgi:N-acetylneuraminic acid mutarotase